MSAPALADDISCYRTISGRTIDGSLVVPVRGSCVNDPRPQGARNRVAGDKEAQCRNF
jgi:hypothetical protein